MFTEGTTTMHASGVGRTHEEILKQVESADPSVWDFASYLPVGKAVQKLKTWRDQGAEILYLTSRTARDQIEDVRNVLKGQGFPDGRLLFRQDGESYAEIAERVIPDVLIEDDCECIGGVDQMTITRVAPEIKSRIKSIPVKEFAGIDHLPDVLSDLFDW